MAWVLVAILGVVAAGLAWGLFRMRRRRQEIEGEKEQAEVRATTLAAQAQAALTAKDAAEERVTALEAQANEAEADLAALKATADPRLIALWALAQIEQQRAWRLSLAAVIEGEPDGLPGALAMEVDRIREEVGTPGSLELKLDQPVAVDDAALALLAARELLAALVPHTQAYDMVIGRNGPRLAIEVVCTGWEGPTEAADDISRLLAAIAPAGGDLHLDTDADGRLRAVVQLQLAG